MTSQPWRSSQGLCDDNTKAFVLKSVTLGAQRVGWSQVVPYDMTSFIRHYGVINIITGFTFLRFLDSCYALGLANKTSIVQSCRNQLTTVCEKVIELNSENYKTYLPLCVK